MAVFNSDPQSLDQMADDVRDEVIALYVAKIKLGTATEFEMDEALRASHLIRALVATHHMLRDDADRARAARE